MTWDAGSGGRVAGRAGAGRAVRVGAPRTTPGRAASRTHPADEPVGRRAPVRPTRTEHAPRPAEEPGVRVRRVVPARAADPLLPSPRTEPPAPEESRS